VPAFHSLRYRDYRLLWAGAAISNTGTWMQHVALSWYVLELTGSVFWVGAVTFANFFPMWLSPLGGVLADRFDRRKLLLATQAAMMLAAVALGLLATTGRATIGPVMVITTVSGLAFAVDAPTRQAFFPSLVPRDAMVNAIALNSAQFSLARVIGPAIGGLMIGGIGVETVFWVNAGSFLAMLAALWVVRGPERLRSVDGERAGGLRAGLAYAWRHPVIRAMLASTAVLSVFAGPISALLPVFARDIFEAGPGGFGILAAALGLGSVGGAILLGRIGRVNPRMIAGAIAVSGAALIAFALSPGFAAAIVAMVLFGVAYLFCVSATNSQIQTTVEESARGRILGLFLLAFGGTFPLGSLVAGAIASATSVVVTTIGGALVCVGWGVALLLRWRARREVAAEPTPS